MSKELKSLEKVYGRLTILGESFRKEVGKQGQNYTYVECRCECGTVVTVNYSRLKNGKTKSCGCMQKELASKRLTTHGCTKHKQETREYRTWMNMLDRCRNSNHYAYCNYGGRGIKVCERWLGKTGFQNFLEDMGSRPSSAHSLDRIDNNGHYCPENCRWATKKEQGNNQRTNRLITAFGRTQTLTQWATEFGCNVDTLWRRLNKLGWPVEKALTTPVATRNR